MLRIVFLDELIDELALGRHDARLGARALRERDEAQAAIVGPAGFRPCP